MLPVLLERGRFELVQLGARDPEFRCLGDRLAGAIRGMRSDRDLVSGLDPERVGLLLFLRSPRGFLEVST